MKERIRLLARTIGVSERMFSLSIGKSESFVRTIKDNIGSDVIRNILQTYPTVNPYWLLLGEGEMFLKSDAVDGMKNTTDKYEESLREQILQLKELLKTKDELINMYKVDKM